jgi:ADP-ribose pyrophosphatase YjhB (NUDIX family)
MLPILFMKANVKGHVRGGKWVSPYSTKAPGAKQKVHAPQLGLFGGSKPAASGPKAPPVAYHPSLNDDGQPVVIHAPHKASAEDTWTDADLPATFVPGGPVPAELNGVPFAPWSDAPTSSDEWEHVEGQNADLDEPPLELAHGKHAGAGVVIEEDDGRVWLVAPTNGFGSYKHSFPKGTAEMNLSLQANAIREAWEESGLQVEITGFLMDVERTTSVARYYTARRVGGTPSDMGWESQAVVLCPVDMLYSYLNMETDHGIAEALGAGPKPKKQAS